MPTINVQPRYPERQNSILTNCGAHHVKSLANKFTQLALQDATPTRPTFCGYQNANVIKVIKPMQSSTDKSMSKRFRNTNALNDFKRTDTQTNNPKIKSESSNKKMLTMPVSKARVTITESTVQLRRMHIKEYDKKERNKISIWSKSCTESYLGQSTSHNYSNNSQTRKFSTLPLPKHQPNSSTLEKTNTKYLQKSAATNRLAQQSTDMNRNHGKQGCENNDNVLNEKLSTSEKQINVLTEKYNESKMISENNANSNRLPFNPSNSDDCGDLKKMFFNSNRTNDRERINKTQLIHPDWRKVPWKQYFGWTDDHQYIVNQLQEQVRAGELRSMYYRSAEQHAAAMAGGGCLPGPTVSTVREMLEVMERAMDGWRESCERRTARWRPPSTACCVADYEH